MNEIVGEHKAAQEEEVRQIACAERRSRIFGHVRFTFVMLLLATLAVFGYNYRDQLSKMWASKPGAEAKGKASSTVAAAQQTAATRDAIISQITQ